MSCWFDTAASVAYSAAMVTKTKMPPTQAAIAISDRRVGRCPLICAFRSVVITRAIAPSGCTTIRGAYDSAANWQTMASPSMTVPTTQEGRRSSRHS